MQKHGNYKHLNRICAGLIIALFCFGIFKVYFEDNLEQSAFVEIKGCIIVIDPGHGASDSGAIGTNTKVKEKTINLAVALKLKALFENAGATVIMTRDSDEKIAYNKDSDMYTRRILIRDSNADLVISIHCNRFYGSSAAAGPQVYYCKGSEKGELAAKYVQTQLNSKLAPAKKRKQTIGDYYILKSGKAPCILVECGFLSNAREERLLQQSSYQDKIASAIFAGTRQYFSTRPLQSQAQEPQSISESAQP